MNNQYIADLIIAMVLFFNVWRGYKTGFLQSVFTLAGLIVALFMALSWYTRASLYLAEDYSVPYHWAEFLSFSCIWLSISLIFNVIGCLLKKIAATLLLGWLDGFGGAILGIGKGLLLVSLILISFTRLPLSPAIKQYLQNSYLTPPLLKLAPSLYLKVARLFLDPYSQHYLPWYLNIQKIYQDFLMNS